jgi:hypothetical protein
MAKRKRDDLGFDVKKAIAALHDAALAAGAVPKDDPRAASPEQTAFAHLHGLEPDSCKRSPCRLAGLCHALGEITEHQAELVRSTELLDVMAQTHDVEKWLRNAGFLYVQALNALVERGKARHAAGARLRLALLAHDHELLCVRPARILLRLTAFLQAVENFDDELRELLASRQLRQPASTKPADLLLTAVWQHLDWGGLTCDEIAKLVPDGNGVRGAADRVRKRVGSRNARCMMPRELHPAFGADRKRPDKRRKRRSSG